MIILKNKILENIVYALISLILSISSYLLIKNIFILIFFIMICLFFIFKIFYYNKILNSKNYFSINTLCTGKKQNIENFGDAKNYEFEPLESKEYDKIIYVKIFNDEAGGLFNKKHKIKLNHGYTLYFKYDKSGKKIADQEHYLGFERYVLPE